MSKAEYDDGIDFVSLAMWCVLLGMTLALISLMQDAILETGSTLRALYILMRDQAREGKEFQPASVLDGLTENVANSATRGEDAKEAHER